jgi:FtsX-like permease family protein
MLQEVFEGSLDQPRLNTRLLLVFALAALALASVGLYGMVTLVVTARTREIGVRMALGAESVQIGGQRGSILSMLFEPSDPCSDSLENLE